MPGCIRARDFAFVTADMNRTRPVTGQIRRSVIIAVIICLVRETYIAVARRIPIREARPANPCQQIPLVVRRAVGVQQDQRAVDVPQDQRAEVARRSGNRCLALKPRAGTCADMMIRTCKHDIFRHQLMSQLECKSYPQHKAEPRAQASLACQQLFVLGMPQ